MFLLLVKDMAKQNNYKPRLKPLLRFSDGHAKIKAFAIHTPNPVHSSPSRSPYPLAFPRSIDLSFLLRPAPPSSEDGAKEGAAEGAPPTEEEEQKGGVDGAATDQGLSDSFTGGGNADGGDNGGGAEEGAKGEAAGEMMYDLYSILIHQGSADRGHYYAYIKNLDDGNWYNFNDSSVTKISDE